MKNPRYASLNLTEDHIGSLTLQRLEEISKSSPRLRNFFGILKKVNDDKFAVFGGAVRDWYLGRKPKDIDIVLDCSSDIVTMLADNFKHKKSQFDGYQFEIDGINLDIWRLEDSWYFKQGNKHFVIQPSWPNLICSTPFYMDAVLVFKNGRVLQNLFYKDMADKVIELQNSVNKNPKLFIAQRALRFKSKYGFKIGPVLQVEIDRLKSSDKDMITLVAEPAKHFSSN